eukprot:g3603.t1
MYSWRVEALDKWLSTKPKPVSMETMLTAGHLDQYHYLGLDANDDVISLLQLNPAHGNDEQSTAAANSAPSPSSSSTSNSKKILDIGCGIGGPARYIAWKTGCTVHGFDIQGELVDAATRVAKEVGIAHLTRFEHADCTSPSCTFPDTAYDGFYCILVLLHILLKPRLVALQKIHDNLADSASFVIEDYLLKTPNGREDLTDEEKHLLEDVIGAVCAPTVGDYRQHLESVGFVDVEFEDLSAVWTKWTVSRRDRFLSTLAEGRTIVAAKKTNAMTKEEVDRILDAQQTISA